MLTSDWKNTKLWKQLVLATPQSAEDVRILLSNHMPNIQAVLRQGGTSPSDFTLHDDGHSFRVAERMVDIIPQESFVGLSVYELGLLLLSAYLHDIGMTPERNKVSSHYHYLLTGQIGSLENNEITTFQTWLDDYQGGIVPPLTSLQITPEVLSSAEFIITHYCRARHNDWSEEWIRNVLSGAKMGVYAGWLDDLVVLCRSHHYGYGELRNDRFNPRPVAGGEIVHLRYLACMLRVADILEFDPERTPDVIFQHRRPHPSSNIFWWKDHDITIVREQDNLNFTARPNRAFVHKAIEETADQVDEELRICNQLANETHFEKCPGIIRELPHRWTLPHSVHRDIKPIGESYEYIDGAFRPDTRKLLELLSGTELYGSSVVAVRELLQNAFDAVREQIAYERLALPNCTDISSLELGNQHLVRLSLERTDGDYWLVCEDNGVGMTKRIISDFLLVSGRGVRHEILDLERRCEKAGFTLGRTGQFGIGVLSYFMLASRIIIQTRRSQESGSAEVTGWQFETNGIGSFGELRKTEILRGTTIRFQLKPQLFGSDRLGWCNQLRKYLHEILVRIPCKFEFIDNIENTATLSFQPGWIRSSKDFTEMVIGEIESRIDRLRGQDVPEALLPLEVRAERDSVARNWEAIYCEMRDAIRWQTKESDLPNKMGVYRVHSCFFDLPRGSSLAFLRAKDQGNTLALEKIGKGHSLLPAGSTISAWKGMRVGFGFGGRSSFGGSVRKSYGHRYGLIIEIDIVSSKAGSIAVNRNAARLDTPVQSALRDVENVAVSWLKELVETQTASVYRSLNAVLLNEPVSMDWPPYWIQYSENGAVEWRPIASPAISSLAFTYGQIPSGTYVFRGKSVSVIRCLGQENDDDHYDGLSWHGAGTPPNRIVIVQHRSGIYQLVPLWEGANRHATVLHPAGVTAKFSPVWKHIVGVKFGRYVGATKARIVWNLEHPLVASINTEAWTTCQTLMKKDTDPLAHREFILSDRAHASSWIAQCLINEQWQLWDGLKDRDPTFLPEVYGLIFGRGKSGRAVEDKICFFVEDGYDRRLRVLQESGWSAIKNADEGNALLKKPGVKWCLEYRPSAEEIAEVGYIKSILGRWPIGGGATRKKQLPISGKRRRKAKKAEGGKKGGRGRHTKGRIRN